MLIKFNNMMKSFIIILSIFILGYILLTSIQNVNGWDFAYPYIARIFQILLTLFFIGCFFMIQKFFLRYFDFLESYQNYILTIIILVSFIFKLYIMNVMYSNPIYDFEVYHDIASNLINGVVVRPEYISVFPHVIGYPAFLAIFYKMFGAYPYVAYLVNVILSSLLILVTYKMVKTLFGSKMALMASLLISFFPSYIFLIPTVSAEALFTLLFYCTVYLFIVTLNKNGYIKYFLFALIGILISTCNAVRPMAIILIPAFILYRIITNKLNHKKELIHEIACFILLFLFFNFTNTLISSTISNVIGKQVATKYSGGYSLLVGTNVKSSGTYNLDDSANFLYEYYYQNKPADEAHKVMIDKAFLQINNNKLAIIDLFIKKIDILWGNDAHSILYFKAEEEMYNILSKEFLTKVKVSTILSNAFYFAALFYAIYGIFKLKFKPKNGLYLFVIIFLGSFCSHLLLEVHARYHYYLIPVFVIASSYGLLSNREKMKIYMVNGKTIKKKYTTQ